MSRAVALLVLFPFAAAAADPPIPRTPTAPPQFARDVPPETFRCQRSFIYKGKVLNCDSNLHSDGEHLRAIIEKVTPAVQELNTYQDNRRSVSKLAYVGTLGIVIALGGTILSRQLQHPTSTLVRNISLASGLGLAIGTALIGVGILKTNEEHLGNAVKLYNQGRPDDPIELQFSTNIQF